MPLPTPLPENLTHPWFAIRVRSNYERVLSSYLESRDFHQYLPLYRDRRQWSDRVREIDLPLFAGYVFCRLDPERTSQVLGAPGVVNIVGYGAKPEPIAEHEIAAIRKLSESGLRYGPHPFLNIGQRVQVRCGPLKGLQGFLLQADRQHRLIVSLDMLQRSVVTHIDRLDIEPIP